MGSRDSVPVGADLLRRKRGTMTRGPEKGREVVVELYEGTTSHGYKSDYKSVRTRFVRWRVLQDNRKWRSRSWRFTGRRFEEAEAEFEKVAALVEATTPPRPDGDAPGLGVSA